MWAWRPRNRFQRRFFTNATNGNGLLLLSTSVHMLFSMLDSVCPPHISDCNAERLVKRRPTCDCMAINAKPYGPKHINVRYAYRVACMFAPFEKIIRMCVWRMHFPNVQENAWCSCKMTSWVIWEAADEERAHNVGPLLAHLSTHTASIFNGHFIGCRAEAKAKFCPKITFVNSRSRWCYIRVYIGFPPSQVSRNQPGSMRS